MPVPDDVDDWLRSRFPSDQFASASALLGSAVDHEGRPASPRLQRCAAYASGGRIEDLRRLVELLRIDFRDVIVPGEYDVVDGALVRRRDFDRPMRDG